jgi:hypothetical protein
MENITPRGGGWPLSGLVQARRRQSGPPLAKNPPLPFFNLVKYTTSILVLKNMRTENREISHPAALIYLYLEYPTFLPAFRPRPLDPPEDRRNIAVAIRR